MGGFAILDVAIGLALVYLLLALVCTTIMEWIAQLRNLRGRALVSGVQSLLGEAPGASPVTDAVFNHSLVDALKQGGRTPSYLPSSVFAKTLKDVLEHRPRVDGETGTVAPAPSPKLQESLRTLSAGEAPDGAAATARGGAPTDAVVAEWFDHAMDRVSGDYKRTTQRVVIWLALAVTVAMNANSLSLTTLLWQNPTLREYMVERAKVRLDQGRPLETVEYADPTTPIVTPPISRDTSKSPDRLLAEEQTMLGQVFSWSGEGARIARFKAEYGDVGGISVWALLAVFGWIVTALAVSLGAPFWFDTLSTFMRVRSTGDVPAKTSGAKS